ncbi:hypothetical protein [Helicobacter cinaedi]|uniref:hypothetical protein n=1 Tax=Helicobacter cinaedi TaxID=213 RepID=UPI0015F28D1A|nr:hypothetical protein [Helicobacter cinaedi]
MFDNMRFYVIAGEGALYYLDCVNYDFTNLEAECLEHFYSQASKYEIPNKESL